MAAPYLHALSCSKCGAALSAAQGQQLLTCQYCQQVHVFVPPPPPERPGTVYKPGESVAVEWGDHWWPATLLHAVGPHEWRVHFHGWHKQYDTVVGPSRIRHISQATRTRMSLPIGIAISGAMLAVTLAVIGVVTSPSFPTTLRETFGGKDADAQPAGARYKEGQAVDILYGSTWYPGRVLRVQGKRYEVSYDGWSQNWNEWVDESRLRPLTLPATDAASSKTATAQYAVGDAVQIEWRGSWFPGRVLEVTKGRYKISYDGYESSSDEWVDPGRLRPP